jgi:Photosynthesis affected mutant 68
MSASWDEDREGTLLGTEEFSRNLDNIKQGLTRSGENARLRERMDEFTAEDIAILERNEAAKEKRRQSFDEKFGNELE